MKLSGLIARSYDSTAVAPSRVGVTMPDQALHTDDSIHPLRIPGVEFQIGAMIALTDFT